MPLTTFTLTRLPDGRVHEFTARGTTFGCLAYGTETCGFRIHWHPQWGWCATDADGDVVGLPLDLPRPEQRNRPPQGAWVRREGDASHVYTLRWGRAARESLAA